MRWGGFSFYRETVGFLASQVVSTDTAVRWGERGTSFLTSDGEHPDSIKPLCQRGRGGASGYYLVSVQVQALHVVSTETSQWDCRGTSLHVCGIEVCAPHWAFANVDGLVTQCLLCFFLFCLVRLPLSRGAFLSTKKLIIYGCEIWRSWISICKIKLNRISYWEERKCALKWIAVEIETPWETPLILATVNLYLDSRDRSTMEIAKRIKKPKNLII